MDFEGALKALKEGKRAFRSGWNGKNMFVHVQYPDARSKMTEPYIYLQNAQGGLIPWIPSSGDLFAEDWMVKP